MSDNEIDPSLLNTLECCDGTVNTSSKVRKRLVYEDESSSQSPPSQKDKKANTVDDIVDLVKSNKGKKRQKVLNGSHAQYSNGSSTYSHMPLAGPSVQVTSVSGERLWVRVQQTDNKPTILDLTQKAGQLLGVPISFMMEKLHQEEVDKEFHARTHARLSTDTEDVPSQQHVPTELWAEKYAPKKFTELLSDEVQRHSHCITDLSQQSNRKVLQWLKYWKEETTAIRVLSPQKKKGGKNDSINSKIVLLCGPPGIGKTTLAHVIAKHAGYHPVEINARSKDIFLSKVLNAVEMQANWIGNNKPNCLIIDEIDGITDKEGDGAVEALVELVTGKLMHKGKKKSTTINLSRPIICICNNQYVPVLKKLRAVAAVHTFDKPRKQRLLERLKEICTKENLEVENQILSALCELTECDIRSCLNTLQFVRSKSSYVTTELLTTTNLGHKDVSKNLFEIWKDIFQAPTTKKKALSRIMNEKLQAELSTIEATVKAKPTSYFDKLYSLLEDQNDNQKIIEGCFENYLSVHFNDPMLNKLSECLEWTAFYDLIEKHVKQEQHFQLTKFVTAVPMAFHKVCGVSNVTPTLTFPKGEYEFKMKKKQNHDILQSFHEATHPLIYRSISTRIITQELISPLLDILAPSIRPVNQQLMNAKEKCELHELVSTMAAYGLKYTKAEDNTLQLVPPVEELATFSGVEFGKRHRQNSLILQQIISQELRDRIKKQFADPATESNPVAPLRTASKAGGVGTKPVAMKDLIKTATVSNIQPAKDIFGRDITPKSKSPTSKNTPKISTTPTFRFKFHEGTTDAVKRTVLIKNIL